MRDVILTSVSSQTNTSSMKVNLVQFTEHLRAMTCSSIKIHSLSARHEQECLEIYHKHNSKMLNFQIAVTFTESILNTNNSTISIFVQHTVIIYVNLQKHQKTPVITANFQRSFHLLQINASYEHFSSQKFLIPHYFLT